MKHKRLLTTLIKEFKMLYDLYEVELKVYDYKSNINAYSVYITKSENEQPILLCDRYFTNKELRDFLYNLLRFHNQIRI